MKRIFHLFFIERRNTMGQKIICIAVGWLIVGLVLSVTMGPADAQPNFAKVKEYRIERSIPPEAVACIECHKAANPGLFDDWARSRHANANITCLDCHYDLVHNESVSIMYKQYRRLPYRAKGLRKL